jgi:hypothetical protein
MHVLSSNRLDVTVQYVFCKNVLKGVHKRPSLIRCLHSFSLIKKGEGHGGTDVTPELF